MRMIDYLVAWVFQLGSLFLHWHCMWIPLWSLKFTVKTRKIHWHCLESHGNLRSPPPLDVRAWRWECIKLLCLLLWSNSSLRMARNEPRLLSSPFLLWLLLDSVNWPLVKAVFILISLEIDYLLGDNLYSIGVLWALQAIALVSVLHGYFHHL